MGLLEGKVALVTGAGRGIGRGHALLLAEEGAKVVVNDFGGKWDGTGEEKTPADEVVNEIKAAGGEAIANYGNVASFTDSKAMVDQAIDTFGQLNILVNNAGILRDKMIFNMTEDEFDSVISVHLKGTFNCSKHACAYWREQHKAGNKLNGRIINTTSDAGMMGNAGQANYGSAKSGIATLTIIMSREMSKYGVTVNAVCPAARTRLTVDATPKFAAALGKKPPESKFDEMAPENIAPMVAYLASDAAKRINGQVFGVYGARIDVKQTWSSKASMSKSERWTPSELVERVPELLKKK